MRESRVAVWTVAALGVSLVCACRRSALGNDSPRVEQVEQRGVVADARDGGDLTAIPRNQLCVTSGNIASGSSPWAVHSPMMRAFAAEKPARDAMELRFRYLGPTAETTPLASGEVRHQVGVKLRARDTCNVVYAMWYLDVGGEIRVSVKYNAGMSRQEECGDRGYINLRPVFSRPVQIAVAGERHTMLAEIHGTELVVAVDGARVWQASLPSEAFTFDGPAGVRSDNADLELEMRAPRAASSAASRTRCP